MPVRGKSPLTYPSRALALLLFFLALAASAAAQTEMLSEPEAADRIAGAVRSAGLQNVLVVDFLDAGGARTDKGVYFAAAFAKALSSQASGFSLADRWAWFSLLEKKTVAAADVEQSEGIRRICDALKCDAVVTGRWTDSEDAFHISLTLRSAASGQSIDQAGSETRKEPRILGRFPAVSDASGVRFYFPGFDGIPEPKCISCPGPRLTRQARKKGIQGTVFLSALLGTDGRLSKIVLLQPLEQSLDRSALKSVERFEFEPLRDPSGQPVSARFVVQIWFRLS